VARRFRRCEGEGGGVVASASRCVLTCLRRLRVGPNDDGVGNGDDLVDGQIRGLGVLADRLGAYGDE